MDILFAGNGSLVSKALDGVQKAFGELEKLEQMLYLYILTKSECQLFEWMTQAEKAGISRSQGLQDGFSV